MDLDLLKYYFPLIFVLFWLVISIITSRIGGWAALAKVYRCEDSFEGERWRFKSGQMRYAMSYNNCLTIGADRRGMYLSVVFLFRVGHPPLFIPWSAVTVSEKKGFFVTMTEFRFARVPGVYLRISSAVAEKVLAKNIAPGEQRAMKQ